MKRLFAILLAVVMVLALAACQPEPPVIEDDGLIKVGIVNLHPSESGYREANVKDMESVFTEANGYNAKFANYNELDAQINAAADFITEGVDYILISAAKDTGWDAVLQDAADAGIKVFLFDRMIDCSDTLYEAAVVSDMNNQGDTAVAWLLHQDLDEYNVIHIQGQIGSAAQKGRTAALDREIDAGKINLVSRGTGGDTWSGDEAKKIVEAVIASGDSFNVIYAENDGMADGATKALDEAGITYGVEGDVVIMGFDCNRFALRNVMSGKWNYDGQCSPFQADVIDAMIKGTRPIEKLVISEELGFDHFGNGAVQVTQEVIDKYGLGE